jgi:hypothetical protein
VTVPQRRLPGGAVILEARKPAKWVAVALANKAVRIVWSVLPKMKILARHTSGRLWATTTLRRSQIDFSQLRTCGTRQERAPVMRCDARFRAKHPPSVQRRRPLDSPQFLDCSSLRT